LLLQQTLFFLYFDEDELLENAHVLIMHWLQSANHGDFYAALAK